jgi:glutamate dehydrogenase (NADP+)
VVTLSDRSGYIHDAEGLSEEKLAYVIDLKTRQRKNLSEYAREFGCDYYPDQKPWHVPCDLAFPCATQNEIDEEAARVLLNNGCILVSEGANMPTTHAGAQLFEEAEILYAPSKAANAGGVAISGLEMTQNAMRLTWSRDEVDRQLRDIMGQIHDQCVEYGRENGTINYVKGANIAGFVKVADAMTAYGIL